LKGQGYESPVSYWMPFNGGIGLHDATWRGAFGGSIYRGGGSHGCVNLPFGVAQQLYGVISEGDPVVVY
ncbi:MAG: L,D-transpeptidase, partial [Clostridia bacterium]|nr:L,D-transpeptidase [Clostridia bacterium]